MELFKRIFGWNSKAIPRAFSSSVEGSTMPVFTFEKISPPIRRASAAAPASEKPRSVIVQFLDRFVEARVKRAARVESEGPPRQEPGK
jgi:hypothetical protein